MAAKKPVKKPVKKPASSGRPRRLTPQKQQEHVSRSQFVEAFAGWICNPLGEDFGEDFLVSIYDDGRSTGLTFQLQLKSTTSVKSFVPKRTPAEIHYSLFVADLEHWEDAAPPVFVVVWDVAQRQGFWQDVPAIIDALSKQNKKWRSNQSATVTIPLSNCLDAKGREALRQRVGRLVLPAIARKKTLEISPTFIFPKTPAGQSASAAVTRAIEEGERITIKKENIAQLKMSPWWERIFGKADPLSISILPSTPSIHLPVALEAVSSEGVERIALDLKRVQAGTQLQVFENDAADDPVKFTITLDKRKKRKNQPDLGMRLNFKHPHIKVHSSLVLTRLLIHARETGTVRVLVDGKIVGVLQLDPTQLPAADTLRAWERLLKLLSIVQIKTARYGEFALKPNVTTEDLKAVATLRVMCTAAREETQMTLSAALNAPISIPATKNKNPARAFSLEVDPFGDVELFGVTVPCGRVRVDFLDTDAVFEELQAAENERRTKLTFKNARVRLHYLEWMPPASGPAYTAASRVLGERDRKPKSPRK